MDTEQQQLSLKWDADGGHSEGEARTNPHAGRQVAAARQDIQPGAQDLLKEAVARENLFSALKKVTANKGAPGVDGMTVKELPGYLKENWPQIKEQLLGGKYRPASVKRVEIPKPGGGTRELGIPTVLDRFIQQAILQVLTPVVEPTFADQSYGFRPKRSAHQAVRKTKEYADQGFNYVVDLDISKFFDNVNHDILMAKMAKLIGDKQLLRLIRRYLNAGVMTGGIAVQRVIGTPQGGPLSPVLANVYLTELDAELDRRGHRFVRYADDCNVYLRSAEAAERVMQSITAFLDKRLCLAVNAKKSAIGRVWQRPFLGFTLTRRLRITVDRQAIKRVMGHVKQIARKGRGNSLEWAIWQINQLSLGWVNYFALSETSSLFRDLDRWIRRRLRCLLWRRWKRYSTRYRELGARGVTGRARQCAYSSKGPWHLSLSIPLNHALPVKFFADQGLISLLETYQRLDALRTAGCV